VKEGLRIKRLERLWGGERPICAHAFTLIVDGEMVQDDAPCACGGERITVIAAHEEGERRTQESQLTKQKIARAAGEV
jgi:hypothetical protein